MLRSTKVALIVVLTGGVAVTAVVGLKPQVAELMYCGHEKKSESLLQQLNLIHSSHHCISGRAVMDLAQVYLAQQMYSNDENCFATTLLQLTNHFQQRRADYAIVLEGDGKNWSARVPKGERLAGHYLLTSDGVVYFNAERPAEDGDAVLRRIGGAAPNER